MTLIELLNKEIELINKRYNINTCYIKAGVELVKSTNFRVDSHEYVELWNNFNALYNERERIDRDIISTHNQIDVLINDMLN